MGRSQAALAPREWPVEWQPVHGGADGPLLRLQAHLLCRSLGLLARLPTPAFEALIGGASWVAPRLDRRHARAARGFLRQALGELPRRELEARVRESYRHLARVLVEPRRFARLVPEERRLEHFDVAWTDAARRVVASRGGAILVTPHLGNWEIAIAVANRLGFGPLYAVAKPVKSRPLSRQVQCEREEWGVRLLPRRGAMVDAPKVVRGGGTVAMLLDQRARKRPVLAPFFGRAARCDRSAGVLLKRLRAPVLVFCCVRRPEPLRFGIEFEDCLWPEELEGVSPVEVATRLNASFERMILRHPEQYFWLHDRFKDTPAEVPAGEADDEPCSEEEERA